MTGHRNMVTAWDMNINTGMLKGSGTVPSQSSCSASQLGLAEQLSINQFFMSHQGEACWQKGFMKTISDDRGQQDWSHTKVKGANSLRS